MDGLVDLFQKAEQISRKIFKYQIANKIYDTILYLEQNNEQNQRRWMWELLKNAKEQCIKDEVKIKIKIGKDFLEFSHNGKPFITEDLVCLIEQTSKKLRFDNNDDNFIRSGMGFSTVYLLTKKINIKGIWQDPKNNTFKKFSFDLNRNAKTRSDLLRKIKKSYSIFSEIEKTKAIFDYAPGEKCDTVFRFKLDKHGKKIAQEGILELENSGLLTMMFNKTISSLKIIDEKKNIKTIYSSVSSKILKENNQETISLEEWKMKKKQKSFLLFNNHSNENSCQLAVELSNSIAQQYYKILKTDQTAMIFREIPLIGTEDFPSPVIINCPNLTTNFYTNGLLMEGDSDEIKNNKELFASLKSQIRRFVKFICEFDHPIYNRHFLANIKTPKNFDEDWYRESVQNYLKNSLNDAPIIENCSEEYIEFSKCIIPFAKAEHLNSFHDLLFPIYQNKLIKKGDNYIAYWIDALDGLELDHSNFINIEGLIEIIESKRNVENLIEMFDKRSGDYEFFGWLNKLYAYLSETLSQNEYTQMFQEHGIIPNKKGTFRKLNDLCEDPDIPDPLNKVLKLIGRDLEEECIRKEIKIEVKIRKSLNFYSATQEILEFLKDPSQKPSEKENVCLEILSIIPEKTSIKMDVLYFNPNFMNTVRMFFERFKFKEKVIKEKIAIPLWKKAENFLTKQITGVIESHTNMERLANYLKEKEEKVMEILVEFYKVLLNGRRIKEISKNRIFWKKSREFYYAKDLTNVTVGKDEYISKKQLENIISGLKNTFIATGTKQASLIDRDLLPNSEKKKVKSEFFEDNKEEIDGFESSIRKDFKGFFENNENTNKNEIPTISLGEDEETVQKILVNMNVTSIEQFKTLKKSSKNCKIQGHLKFEAFKKVQEHLNKAKCTVLEFLKKNVKYDVSLAYFDKVSPNQNILKNVKKDGRSLHIVVRPVIGNKIMIHNDLEMEEIKDNRNELWISDGKKAFQILDILMKKGEFKVFHLS